MRWYGVFAATGISIWVLFIWACFSTGGSVDETAREVPRRAPGPRFIVVLAITFCFSLSRISGRND